MDTDMTETIYDYIGDYINKQDISPVYQEIAEACHVSISTVEKHLIKLEEQKRIARTPGKSRSIRLIKADEGG